MLSSPDSVNITGFINDPPTAAAGTYDFGADGSNLDGSTSSDPEGDSLTYTWSEVTAHGVTFGNNASMNASDTTISYNWPTPGEAVISVTVRLSLNDGYNIPVTADAALKLYRTDYAYVQAGGAGDGSAPDNAIANINNALSYANTNSRVAVAVREGVYNVLYPSTHIVMVAGISLYGGYSSDWLSRDAPTYTTTITDTNSAASSRVIDCNSTTASTIIDGFRINAGGGGGSSVAIFCSGASPTIQNNIISAGSATESYGIHNINSSSPNILNNTINGGSGSSRSYGIYNDTSSMTISKNTINGGSGGNCYGIYNFSSVPIISKNTINGGNGGGSNGIYNDSSAPTIANNTINGGNGSISSRGIFNFSSSSPTITNNTINSGSGNSRFGVYNETSAPTIANNTIDGGSSGTQNMGIYIDSSGAIIENNIIFASSHGIYEPSGSTDPAAVNNNDIFDCAIALYYNEGSTPITDIGTVNGLAEANNNISEDISASLDGEYRFTGDITTVVFDTSGKDLSGSVNTDKDDVDRSSPYSIGAYEYDP